MPTFEDCANCGELLSEHYGAATEDKCVECNSAERRVLTRTPAAVPVNQQQDDMMAHDDFPKVEQRR